MTNPGVHLAGEAVVAFVDDELGSVAHARALVHLDTCVECRRAVTVQREASRLLAAAPDPVPPAGLLGRLREIPMTTDIGGPDVVFAIEDGDLVWGTASSLRGRPVPNLGHEQDGRPNRGPDLTRRDRRPPSYPHVRASRRTHRARRVLVGAVAGLAFGVFAATASPSVYTGTTVPDQNLIRDVNGGVVGPPITSDLVGVRQARSHPRGSDLGLDHAGIAGTQVGFRTAPDSEPGADADRASRLVGRSATGTGMLTNPFHDTAGEPGRAAR